MLAAALYLIVVELRHETQRRQSENRNNVAWEAMQIERELHVLMASVDSLFLAEPGTTRADLIDRFDVFWSRIAGADAGEFGDAYTRFEGVPQLIAETRQTLRDVEPLILTFESGDATARRAVKQSLGPLLAEFRRVALLAHHQQNIESARIHERLEKAEANILLIFAGVLIGSAILIALLVREMKRRNQLHASLERRVEARTRELQQEVMQRKHADEKLRDSLDRIHLIADNLPVLISYLDRDLRYQFVNRTFAQWYDRSIEQVLGCALEDVVGRVIFDQMKPKIDLAFAGAVQCFEQVIPYPDGKTRVIELTYVPHLDEYGTVRGCIALALDITARKQAEQEVHKLNAELEQRVEARTIELRSAQETLLRKERLAVLGQLTGTVAHEIRNPLGAIATSASVIEHKCRGTKLQLEPALERIFNNIKRCDKIVTELLDFARAKGLQPEPIALDAWILEMLEEYRLPESITLKCNLQSGPAVVSFDKDELRRAVINVIDNACQSMADGVQGPDVAAVGTLTVATRINRERVEIAISDTGCGIPEDILPQILEPLFSSKAFGTGLGLPTVQRILEDHGGGLEIKNTAGAGVEAILWLPLDLIVEGRLSA